MTDGIDYEAVAKQFQLENEVLRSTVKHMSMGNSWSTVKPDVTWFTSLSWQDRYYTVAAACMVVIMLATVIKVVRDSRK